MTEYENPDKPSTGLRDGFALFVTSFLIGLITKYCTGEKQEYMDQALLTAPFLGKLTSAVVTIPLQHILDNLDIRRHKNRVEDLHAEKKLDRTTDKRKKTIDAELLFFEKEIHRLNSKSLIR